MSIVDLAEVAAHGLRQHLDGLECAPVPALRRDNAIAALQTAIAARSRRRTTVHFGQWACCAALVASVAAAWSLEDRGPCPTLLRPMRAAAHHDRAEIQLVDGARVTVDPTEPGTLLLSQGSLIALIPRDAPFGRLRVRTPHAVLESRDAATMTIQVSLARSAACGDSVTRVHVRSGVLTVQVTGHPGELVHLIAPTSWQSCEP